MHDYDVADSVWSSLGVGGGGGSACGAAIGTEGGGGGCLVGGRSRWGAGVEAGVAVKEEDI